MIQIRSIVISFQVSYEFNVNLMRTNLLLIIDRAERINRQIESSIIRFDVVIGVKSTLKKRKLIQSDLRLYVH